MMRSLFGTSLLCAILAMISSAHATTATINYTYDPIGRLTEVNYDSGQEMKYGYDPAGNITKVSNWTASQTVATPASLNVPSADSDGSFTVTWGTSTTAGVTYILEEATDSSFTQTVRTAYSGTSTSAVIIGRATATTWYYRVKAFKEGFKDSTWRPTGNGCLVTLPVVTAPGAPAINNIVAGAGRATIYFTAPTNNGGASIAHYTATCEADGEYTRYGTSTTTQIIVTDLIIGVTYDCTVTATNSQGYSSTSSTPATITPAEKDPFPWILFLPAIQNGMREN